MTTETDEGQGGSGTSVDLTGWTMEREKRAAQRCMQALEAMLVEAAAPEVLIILLNVDSFWHTVHEVEELSGKEATVDLFAYQGCGVSWFCANPGNDESDEMGIFAYISSRESFRDDPATATWVQTLIRGKVVDLTFPSLEWKGDLEMRAALNRQLSELAELRDEFVRCGSSATAKRMAAFEEALQKVPVDVWAEAGLLRPGWL